MTYQVTLGSMLALVVSLVLLPAVPARATPPLPSVPVPPGARFFPETGQWLGGAFLRHWEQHGGLRRFGFPISPPLREDDGRIVQWTERARLEYDVTLPAGQRVQLGLLGHEVIRGREAEASFRPVADPSRAEVRFFAPTGHTLSGLFLAHWEAGGGLPAFGYPISEVVGEISPTDGAFRTVQYFERTRFEHHPDLAGTPAEVQLGLLGRELYAGSGTAVPAVPDDGAPSLVPVPPAAIALRLADLPAGFTIREDSWNTAATLYTRLFWDEGQEPTGLYAVASVVQPHPTIAEARLGFAVLAASLADEPASTLETVDDIGEEAFIWSQDSTRPDGVPIRILTVGFRRANVVGVVMTTAAIAASDEAAARQWATRMASRAVPEPPPAAVPTP